MAWTVEFTPRAEKQLDRIAPTVRARILKKLAVVAQSDDPRTTAVALVGEWSGLWRYRVGDYRIVCDIQNDVLRVAVIDVGHRREVYR